ncbi:hypothetical protein HanRHA438_Chr00c08g0847361 [Helianthus annuus]|nr:hypothetical protein HanRHA438_Chr00c08g0847361 [Helianthus annuus]
MGTRSGLGFWLARDAIWCCGLTWDMIWGCWLTWDGIRVLVDFDLYQIHFFKRMKYRVQVRVGQVRPEVEFGFGSFVLCILFHGFLKKETPVIISFSDLIHKDFFKK